MKKYLLILLSFFWSGGLFAQLSDPFFNDVPLEKQLEIGGKIREYWDDGLYMAAGSLLEPYFNENKLTNAGVHIMMSLYSMSEYDAKVISIFERWKSSNVIEDEIIMDKHTANIYERYGWALHRQKKYFDAIVAYEKSLTYKSSDDDMASKYRSIASCYLDMEMNHNADHYVDKSLNYFLSYYNVSLKDIAEGRVKLVDAKGLVASLCIKGVLQYRIGNEKVGQYYHALAAAMGDEDAEKILKIQGVNYKKYLKRIKNK